MKLLGRIMPLILLFANACGQKESDNSDLSGYYQKSKVWSRTRLSVCFEGSGDGSSTQRQHVKKLIKNSWQRYATVSLYGWRTCDSSGADIRVFLDSEITRGRSYVGTDMLAFTRIDDFSGNTRKGNMIIPTIGNSDWRDNTIIHEFGHALGLRHEHAREDSECTQYETNKDFTKYGSYDEDSVMGYCAGATSLSKGDIKLIRHLYGKRYKLSGRERNTYKVKKSGKCLNVKNGSYEKKAPLWQRPCADKKAQRFVEYPTTGKYFLLINERSGRCVNVKGGSLDVNAPIWQWNCTGKKAQEFRKVKVNSTYFMLKNRRSGKCIEVKGRKNADKAIFLQRNCNENSAQLFKYM